MKTVIGFCTAAIFLLTCSTSFAQWDEYNNNISQWTFDVVGKVLDRPGDDNGVPLVTDSVTNATYFSSDNATDLDVGVGLELSFIRQLQPGHACEIEFGMANWDANAQISGNNLQTPFLPGLSPDNIFYQYDSNMFSIEINSRKKLLPGVTWLCGPRFVNLDERVVTDSNTIIPNPPFPAVDFLVRSDVHVKNPLLGGQIGGEYDFQLTRDMFIHTFVKAGGYANFASVSNRTDTTLAQGSPIVIRKTFGAFVGEVGVHWHYDMFPSVLSCFAGYEANWVDGVAIGPTQLLNTATLNTDPTIFYNGFVFGFEARH